MFAFSRTLTAYYIIDVAGAEVIYSCAGNGNGNRHMDEVGAGAMGTGRLEADWLFDVAPWAAVAVLTRNGENPAAANRIYITNNLHISVGCNSGGGIVCSTKCPMRDGFFSKY